MMKKGFGIIGTGAIAAIHAAAIKAMQKGILIGCFDIDIKRAYQFSEKYNCKAYDDLDKMLANDDIHIVTIATPSGLHMDSAVKAANAKKHIIVEKPLEITAEKCDEIIDAAEKNKVLLAGIFPTRFYPSMEIVKKAIENGKLGKMVLADAYVKWYRSQEYYDSGKWRGTWALDGGGALMNQSIHAVDLLQWFAGGVKSVNAEMDTLTHERIEVEDTAVSTVKFNNGALGVIEGTTSSYPGLPKTITIHGSKGTIILEENNIIKWEFENMTEKDKTIVEKYGKTSSGKGGAANPMNIDYIGHQKQFENMVDAVETGTPLLIDGKEAKKAVQIIESIYKSARTNKTINIE